MVTSALFYHVLHLINVTIHIRDVCVFLAPFFSSLTVIVTYHLTKELKVRNFHDKCVNMVIITLSLVDYQYFHGKCVNMVIVTN